MYWLRPASQLLTRRLTWKTFIGCGVARSSHDNDGGGNDDDVARLSTADLLFYIFSGSLRCAFNGWARKQIGTFPDRGEQLTKWNSRRRKEVGEKKRQNEYEIQVFERFGFFSFKFYSIFCHSFFRAGAFFHACARHGLHHLPFSFLLLPAGEKRIRIIKMIEKRVCNQDHHTKGSIRLKPRSAMLSV